MRTSSATSTLSNFGSSPAKNCPTPRIPARLTYVLRTHFEFGERASRWPGPPPSSGGSVPGKTRSSSDEARNAAVPRSPAVGSPGRHRHARAAAAPSGAPARRAGSRRGRLAPTSQRSSSGRMHRQHDGELLAVAGRATHPCTTAERFTERHGTQFSRSRSGALVTNACNAAIPPSAELHRCERREQHSDHFAVTARLRAHSARHRRAPGEQHAPRPP